MSGVKDHDRQRVDRRSDARIVRSALDEVETIRTLLADVYKDAGDGRTLLRELVQNADDAGATRLVCTVFDQGWPDASNSLLRGPALVVANDGPFPAGDRDALHRAVGGSKADDAGKVGRFGIGFKSVFHICEATVYVGADGGTLRPGALNPWAGTGDHPSKDPIHPDWDKVDDEDLRRLSQVGTDLLDGFSDGLVQWIPLRHPEHLDRARDRLYGLGQRCPKVDEVCAWFDHSTSLALLLAQCGYLRKIEAQRVHQPGSVSARHPLVQVIRPGFARRAWVGRPTEDRPAPDRAFKGRIEAGDSAWSVVGVEGIGHDSLRRLRSQEDWPKDSDWRDGSSFLVPRKALAHAAITVLQPDPASAMCRGARLRWAVFLPLDDAPQPRAGAAVECVGPAPDAHAWDIVLHGYFWPSHDRRSIPGVTDDEVGSGDGAMRVRWNQAVRDDLLLPLLPHALASAVENTPEPVARELLAAIIESKTVQTHLASVTRRHELLPVVTAEGVRWETIGHGERGERRVLSIPAWGRAPDVVRRHFVECVRDGDDHGLFIDANAPKLGGDGQPWPADDFQRLLDCVPVKILHSTDGLAWLGAFLGHVLGSPADERVECSATAAAWLTRRIAAGALPPERAPRDAQSALKSAWLGVFAALPSAWIVYAPVASRRAVVELAKEGATGAGLLPIPIGRRKPTSERRPDVERIDTALAVLGKRLQSDERGAQHTRARLSLAETLLEARGDAPLDEELRRLPIVGALRLPDDREEAWSVSDLNFRARSQRVFVRMGSGDDEADRAAAPDPKQAVTALATALGEPVWLVARAAGSLVHAPTPTNVDLARAVLEADEIQGEPRERAGLLKRLAKGHIDDIDDVDDVVLDAMRALLSGRRVAPSDVPHLFYVRSGDSAGDANGRTLSILLRLLNRPWCAVNTDLIERLPLPLAQRLGATAVDPGVLHDILRGCLDQEVDWASLDQTEIVHLLEQLHGTGEARLRWRKMPLHRGPAGGRISFDDRAVRAEKGRTLPAELEQEAQLLDPDPEVAMLYADVSALDEDGILSVMLASSRPQQFARQIADGLMVGGSVNLPRDEKLLRRLREVEWLPLRDEDTAVRPHGLLLLPDGIGAALRPLAKAGALGEYHLGDEVKEVTWSTAQDAVRELRGRPAAAKCIEDLAHGLVSREVAAVDEGAYVLLPEADDADASLIDDIVRSPLVRAHQGWALIRMALNFVTRGRDTGLQESSENAQKAVLALVRTLCGPLSAASQVAMLSELTKTHPLKDSAAGRSYRRLLEIFSRGVRFAEEVMPEIEFPTQDGHWRSACDVAQSASGVARRHRLLVELRDCLGLDGRQPVCVQTGAGTSIGRGTAQVLANYFKQWEGRVPNEAVGAFLALLGRPGKDDSIAELAQHWLGPDVHLEAVRQRLTGPDPRPSAQVFVVSQVARGEHVQAMNLLGQQVEMLAEADDKTIFAVDPVRKHGAVPFWEIRLMDVRPREQNSPDLIDLLGGAVEWWAVRVLGVDRDRARSWWSDWGKGSQAQVAPVRASILAHLPLTLRQLDVHHNSGLHDALKKAERAQRRREQAPDTQLRQATNAERAALDDLARQVQDDPERQRFLWRRVQEMIQRYGYREDSVLLELAQNADDALAQAAEIAGGTLPAEVRRVVVRIHERNGGLVLDFIHYGRAINDTGGTAFPEGREQQWDQDLYFMMLLNLSGKPGEAPGQGTSMATTGRFGLGFKSVHLLSERPAVVSGFLAFSIAGGLLPVEEPVPDDPDEDPDLDLVHHHPATRIRLPLRSDVDTDKLLRHVFKRFAYARCVIPVFAREITEIIVDGGPCAGSSAYHPKPIEDASGWSTARETTELPGHGQWRMLRFRPADAGAKTGTAALLVGLRDGVPKSFPEDLPFLWNVAPTSEGWGSGYAVNGPFKLDPGRTHVSLDDDATLRVVQALGSELGKGLVKLQDALEDTGKSGARGLPRGEQAQPFLAELWRVLASGLDENDLLRGEFLQQLHTANRGLSHWMKMRAVVPSGLPAPFAPRLPRLEPNARVEVARNFSQKLCRALVEVDVVAHLLEERWAVSESVATLLRPLLRPLHGKLAEFHPPDVLDKLTERWAHRITPERLHMLRPLARDEVWQALCGDADPAAWRDGLQARSAAGKFRPLRDLLLPPGLDPDLMKAQLKDEVMRSAFAPDTRVVDSSYIENGDDLRMFLRLRDRHTVDARTMAHWCANLQPDKRLHALRYLLIGELSDELVTKLAKDENRPSWLREADEVRAMLEKLNEDRGRSLALLARLFANQVERQDASALTMLARLFSDDDEEDESKPAVTEQEQHIFFQRFREWWDDPAERQRVLARYEQRAWPAWLLKGGLAEGLRADSHDHWLGLLVLGACRSLGRSKPEQHRTFLERSHQDGWWDVFKSPDDPLSWMKALRTWQDEAAAYRRYRLWMSLFPTIYQLSRHMEKYRRLLISAGRRPEELYRVTVLLTPRVDEALTGAGQHFDAPPASLNMGLHWILRELVRLGIVDGAHIFPDCWIPAAQVIRFLKELRFEAPDDQTPNSEKANAIFQFMNEQLGTKTAHLHRSFDIPLRHVAADSGLQRQLGLKS